LRNFFVFSSIDERCFGFGFLILKQTPLKVLFGFAEMIEIENQFFTDVCYVQHGTSLAHTLLFFFCVESRFKKKK